VEGFYVLEKVFVSFTWRDASGLTILGMASLRCETQQQSALLCFAIEA
jgi:hypothetical protein